MSYNWDRCYYCNARQDLCSTFFLQFSHFEILSLQNWRSREWWTRYPLNERIISFYLFNNFTNTDYESVISGWVLEDRKIIVSDIWQQSIFSKTVRIQLCCWSWAAHTHNVRVDWLSFSLFIDDVSDVHVILKVCRDGEGLIWFPERVIILWTIIIAPTISDAVSITENLGSTEKLSKY